MGKLLCEIYLKLARYSAMQYEVIDIITANVQWNNDTTWEDSFAIDPYDYAYSDNSDYFDFSDSNESNSTSSTSDSNDSGSNEKRKYSGEDEFYDEEHRAAVSGLSSVQPNYASTEKYAHINRAKRSNSTFECGTPGVVKIFCGNATFTSSFQNSNAMEFSILE
jgi:hypothetical protein